MADYRRDDSSGDYICVLSFKEEDEEGLCNHV